MEPQLALDGKVRTFHLKHSQKEGTLGLWCTTHLWDYNTKSFINHLILTWFCTLQTLAVIY